MARLRLSWPVAASGTGAAILGLLAGLPAFGPVDLWASAALAGIMGAIAAEDLRRFRVPDPLNLLAALAGLATIWFASRAQDAQVWPAILRALAQAALAGGALWAVREAFFRLRGVDGLGLGDVKLAAASGMWIGPHAFSMAVLFAAIGALAFIGVRRLVDGSWPPDRKIPFAFYLAPAIWLCWFLAERFPFFQASS
jgi:leader peptidase (prepilin peptidase)/N-methyltransferase